MKTKISVLLLSFLILNSLASRFIGTSFLIAQDTWTKTYDPFYEPWHDIYYEVEDVLITQDGGYVVSGSFDHWIDDDPPHWVEHWGFLMKTDSDGNVLWAKKDSVDFLGENDNYAFVETNDGSFISIGYCFGGSYMIKRDSEGNRLWAVTYSDFGVNSMCKTLDGNIALGGRLFANAALRKMDNDGNTIWTKSYEIGTGSNAYSVYQASDGGYLLTGINYTENDVLIIKTDSNGDSLWSQTFEGFGGDDRGNCVIENNIGDILVAGYMRDPYITGFLWKLDSLGNTLWQELVADSIGYSHFSILNIPYDSFVAYCYTGSYHAKIYKFDYDYNIEWTSELSGNVAHGDRSFALLENEGFICALRNVGGYFYNNIGLEKTDTYGNVPVDENVIISVDNINLICYPNPFFTRDGHNSSRNIEITIDFQNTLNKGLSIEIFNIKGQKVKSFNRKIGTLIWDGKDEKGNRLSSGIYFIKLNKNNNIIKTKKITLIK
ncbi:MAG: T9SS type A sorting domain-containing protein [Candidatus Cloacimonetes bacterium]|nr:T9SS type A sorting domain-containing protein [Candidatus Cloacimonadota bacterium]